MNNPEPPETTYFHFLQGISSFLFDLEAIKEWKFGIPSNLK